MNSNICQFYVIIGDKSFKVPVDNNVYINATDITDFKMIQDEIFRAYKEKAKMGVNVGSEIIFLVGGINDSEKAKDIIKNLRLNGKIEVIKKEVAKQVKDNNEIKANNWLLDNEKDNVKEELKEEKVESTDIKENNIISELDKEVMEDNKINKQPDNIYKRDFDSTNYNGYIGKPIEKKDKFSKLPIIIFIISLLLFIASLVLLFVL